jgi:hypothetical protein
MTTSPDLSHQTDGNKLQLKYNYGLWMFKVTFNTF